MRTLATIFSLLFFINVNANIDDDALRIEREGLVVSVVDFQEGDKLKLFEFESGEHILSKTSDQIDLSMLPAGKYLLENSKGKSVVIERTDEELLLEKALDDSYVVERDSKMVEVEDVALEEELESFYSNSDDNLLAIEREGDLITIVDFKEGDQIKLFEVKNTVHILTKTQGFVDLSQLPAGVYFIENNEGDAVVVEKFVDNGQVADM
ncbi:hypothetical protein [Aquimarina sp. MMG016]|uniref:hypothetical protein n=1 Tax=Aquimarina sp. MMG016 TaxID=2822690 RepID=UPI001B39E470|nr:hypothetical protein [Aquimarina sp. MMG016]MBQ4820337.1 hypothetical protein [Aquimarina sp. MMG016]